MLALIAFSYVRRSASFRVFLFIIPCLILAAVLDVAYNRLAVTLGAVPVVYVLRCLFHAALFTVYFLFTLYIIEVTSLDRKRTNITLTAAAVVLFSVIGVDVFTSVRSMAGADTVGSLNNGGQLVFLIGYLIFTAVNVSLLASVRHRLYRRVMMGFYASMAISFTVLILQRAFGGGSSFTVATFLFPVIAMLYIMHSHPYDAETGTIGWEALADVVRYNYQKQKAFLFLSVFFPEFSGEGSKMPETLRALVRRFPANHFRGALIFQLDNGHMLLLFRRDRNPDCEQRIGRFLRSFYDAYRIYQYDYKIVIGESVDQISARNEYASFIRDIHRTMPVNTVRRITPEDIAAFDRSEYILSQLADIHAKHDLNDPRVLVYCQPVFNVVSGRYDTAEALMRLQLEELGLVFPDQFIFLAEEYGYIHTLTEIILHKTCQEIRKLTDDGFRIDRISVNVSILELKGDSFCGDIGRIITGTGVSGEKVAIELTESQNESDFDIMKSKIAELKGKGIKFYLDDFGTGYSNMERIIELPFDIIKFDRSLVVACGTSQRSVKIVHNMASLFSDLNYSVLYEGVENETDEALCRKMSASYLQGYKFSRPIPISELRQFMEKKNKTG